MMWTLFFGMLALAIAVLLAITTISWSTSERKPGDPVIVLCFTIVWPSGPVVYRYEWLRLSK